MRPRYGSRSEIKICFLWIADYLQWIFSFITLTYLCEVSVHLCMEHGEETGGIRGLCALTGLWSHCNYRDMAGMLSWTATCFLGKTSPKDEVLELPFLWGHLECLELCLRVGDEWVESLQIRFKGQTHEGDTVVGACCRPPDHEEKVAEAFTDSWK